MGIMVAYGVRPRTERLLRKYCKGLTMVARAGYYYCALFKCSRGVIQGDPLPSTTFNMVLDAVILHWEKVVAVEDAGPEGFGRAVKNCPPFSTREMVC